MIPGAPRGVRAWLLGVLVCLSLVLSGLAQAQPAPDMDSWESLAQQSEMVLERDNASDRRLEDLREQIVTYREQFLSAQDTNRTRITTLQAQISALGEPPGDGDPPEATEIGDRRAELEKQLAQLEVPGRAAEEAYNRADGLIREIDRTIRQRHTNEVLSRGPSPLNPALWPAALTDLVDSAVAWRTELDEALASDSRPDVWTENQVAVWVMLVVALALILRGRRALEWLTMRFYAGWRGHSSPALAFVVSLGQVVVPVVGLGLLSIVGFMSGMLGLRGQILAENLPMLGLLLFGAIWLGGRVFPHSDTMDSPLPMSTERRREGRLYAATLALVFCTNLLRSAMVEFDNYDAASDAVLSFPLLLIAGAILVRLGRMLIVVRIPVIGQTEGDETTTSYFTGIVHLIGRLAMALGIAAPLVAAIGYLSAAALLIEGAVGSLALLALLAVLRLVVRDFYAMIMRLDPQQASEALTPVLISFLLTISALPLFALIWGARVTDLSELWARFREGFTLGETQISPSDFVSFAAVFVLGYALTRLLQGALKTSVLPKTRIDTGGRNAITAGIGYVGIFLAAVFAISAAGIDLSSLAIVAGALSVGIGFGLQNIVSNFVSGIILLIERPISEGDWIEVGGQMGYVRDISVRSTRIETFDRTDVIVPNADFVSGTVTNWTRGNLVGRVIVPVGVAYGSDTRQVEAILQEIAEAHPLVVMNPPPAVMFMGFGADSMDFEIRAILRDVNFVLSVKSDMNHEIAARFRAEGIEIPFAQRDLWLRNPEALHGPARGAPAAAPRDHGADTPHLTADDMTDSPSDAGKDDL